MVGPPKLERQNENAEIVIYHSTVVVKIFKKMNIMLEDLYSPNVYKSIDAGIRNSGTKPRNYEELLCVGAMLNCCKIIRGNAYLRIVFTTFNSCLNVHCVGVQDWRRTIFQTEDPDPYPLSSRGQT